MLFAAHFDPYRERYAACWLENHGFPEAVEFYNLAHAYPELLPPETNVYAAFLGFLDHDIGKLSERFDPDAWFYPDSPLDPCDRRHHVPDGIEILRAFEIASGVSVPDEVYQIINGHHERTDGTGYGHMTGPYLSQIEKIACVLDSLVTMCTWRPYNGHHPIHSFASAWEELNKGRDRQYSGEILDALWNMHKDDLSIVEPGLGWIDMNTVPLFAKMKQELTGDNRTLFVFNNIHNSV